MPGPAAIGGVSQWVAIVQQLFSLGSRPARGLGRVQHLVNKARKAGAQAAWKLSVTTTISFNEYLRFKRKCDSVYHDT